MMIVVSVEGKTRSVTQAPRLKQADSVEESNVAMEETLQDPRTPLTAPRMVNSAVGRALVTRIVIFVAPREEMEQVDCTAVFLT